ncbi:hypothetical protein [Cellulomonas sp. ICMP 17802]|uniref:hypothetical protein n=1 Tax=Cellulomonas sp. ICMP 17802 TaxID=3239199 RepID=UPI00351B9654
MQPITVKVEESGRPVEGVEVSVDAGTEPVSATTDDTGQAVVELDDAVDAETVMLITAPGFQSRRSSVADAISAGAPITISHAPERDSFAFRVDPRVESNRERAGGEPPVGRFPTNGVSTSYTLHQLTPLAELGPGVARGRLTRFRTYWEPLGWALDDWVSTRHLAPAEDSLVSAVIARSSARSDAAGRSSDEWRHEAHSRSLATTSEAMRVAFTSRSHARGIDLGLGGSRTTSTNPALNPVAALISEVAGAFQVGVTNATAEAEVDSGAEVGRRISAGIDEAAGQLRAAALESLASTSNEVTDDRTLRALRSTSTHAATNLAAYSVVRQWLVSTVELDRRDVLLVEVDRLSEPLTLEDAVLHRAQLQGRLLDPALEPVLGRAAAAWVAGDHDDPEPTVPAPVRLVRLTGSVVLSDDAGGRGSSIGLVVSSGDDERATTTTEHSLGQPPVSQPTAVDLPVDVAWSTFAGIGLTFHNPGVKVDRRAEVSELRLTATLSDGRQVPLQPWRSIELAPEETSYLPPNKPLPPDRAPASAADGKTPKDLTLLLRHLNHYLSYYRFVIDVQADAMSRFSRLRLRFPGERFGDMQPLGAVGNHLAFYTASDDVHPTWGFDPIRELVSTPTGGTWVESMRGAASAEPDLQPSRTALGFDTIGWPTVSPPPAPALLQATAPDGTVAAAPAPGVTDLGALLTSLAPLLQKTLDAVGTAGTAATTAATGAEPAPAAGAAAGEDA